MPDYEYDFDPDAGNNTASAVFRLAYADGARVLDLGSGPGIVASHLQRAGCHVTCVDTDPVLLEAARQRGVTDTIVADLEQAGWDDEVGDEPFDSVILADVLEHLQDPGALLERLHGSTLLKGDGALVVSIPNAAHEAVLANLMSGRFDYTETGILDRTHIRFFTGESFRALAERHGFAVTRLERTMRTLEQTDHRALAPEVSTELRRWLADRGPDSRTYQYVVRLHRAPTAELLGLRGEVDRLLQSRFAAQEEARQLAAAGRASRQDAEEEARRLRQQLAAERTSRQDAEERASRQDAEERALAESRGASRERARLEPELRRLRDESQALVDRARRAERGEARHRAKVEEVYRSETWRLGRTLTWPARKASALRRGGAPTAGQTAGRRGVQVPAPSVPLSASSRGQDYQRALERRTFDPGATGIVMAVSTTRLEDGRGDLFTAVGLGLELQRLDPQLQIVYCAPAEWDAFPSGTNVVVSLLAEDRATLDPLDVPAGVLLLGWVRNRVDRWVALAGLERYDGLLCASRRIEAEVRQRYRGITAVLPIAVDTVLFTSRAAAPQRRPVAVSTVNSWGGARRLHADLCEHALGVPVALHGQQRGLPDDLSHLARGLTSFFSLPSLYAQSAIVLDDVQEANRSQGTVNSRVFEALAAGALPVTNDDSGLRELGLEDVPVARGSELPARVRALVGDTAARDRLVAQLRGEVLARHTYAHRARAFRDTVREVERWRGQQHLVIGFTPDYRATNPYQEMLYSSGTASGVVVIPTDDPLRLQRATRTDSRDFVFHVHWTARVTGWSKSEADARERVHAFLQQVDDVRARGGRVVWTVHNVLPHECSYPALEERLRQELARRVDIVHVLCEDTVDIVADHYTLPREKVRVVPHSGFDGVYPDVVDRATARRELGLGPDDEVFLHVGGIRPYKGVDRLLDAFAELHRDRPATRLVLAGRPGKFAGVKELEARCQAEPGVVPLFEEIPDERLQVYLRACDVFVLPHRQVLNSSGLFLAWTFARPVVAPRAGCLAGAITPETGRLFEADGSGFRAALESSLELRTPETHAATAAAAAAYTRRQMSDDFLALLLEP